MNFSEKVYHYCKKIPKGKVTTYKEIGKIMKTKAYRAIGTTLKNNPYAPEVPCHKVVRNNGDIGSYQSKFHNLKKSRLLGKEGIKVINNKIDLEKYLHKF